MTTVSAPIMEWEGIKAYFGQLGPGMIALFCAPFVILLTSLATLPLFAPHFWEKNENKGLLALVLSFPLAIFFLLKDWHTMALTGLDYLTFIALLGSLYTISGGIYIRGSFAGLPLVNALFLLAGALLANGIGTTGASMLMIRPLLRANHSRHHKAHIVIFFIFIVSNCSGLLTPLGDPPLFLGFLRGVEFVWTLRLKTEWFLVNVSLLILFYLLDRYHFEREHLSIKGVLREQHRLMSERFGVEGTFNLVYLAAVVGVILYSGYHVYPMKGQPILGEPYGSVMSKLVQAIGMGFLAIASYQGTSKAIHKKNHFNFHPIAEVAILFSGIFVTMVPALMILETQGYKLGVTHPWQFFWMSGALSSFLDNAPTYLTFTSLAKGALQLGGEGLASLAHHPVGMRYLAAVSCGSVFMGANTYIGNGPNFMVKSIAEHAQVKMPSFFGYTVWSLAILIPIFVAVTFLFFP